MAAVAAGGPEFIDPVVSVYEGSYDPEVDYDQMEPIDTLKLDALAEWNPRLIQVEAYRSLAALSK